MNAEKIETLTNQVKWNEKQAERLATWSARYNFLQTQEGLLDLELLQLPKGASVDALRTQESLKPLSCDDYRRLTP